ncbi:MAG: flagellar biosynthesis anti-sigma factor FlgM [Lachnospiraceae bacterium]
MRIDAYNAISQTYGAKGKYKAGAAAKTSSADKVEISDFGRELQVAKQAVAAAPDVREDRVSELKSRIQNGTYSVSGESFAEKLLAKYEEMRG